MIGCSKKSPPGETKPKKDRPRYSKIIVALVVVLDSLFAGACIYAFIKTRTEPAVLIGAWFTSMSGELFAMATLTHKEGKFEHEQKMELIKGGEEGQ